MLELGSSGSVRGVSSNGHPYRDPGPFPDIRPITEVRLPENGFRDFRSTRAGPKKHKRRKPGEPERGGCSVELTHPNGYRASANGPPCYAFETGSIRTIGPDGRRQANRGENRNI